MKFSQTGTSSFADALNGSSSHEVPGPTQSHELLTNTQFVLLVLFCSSCHYVALIISASAVGESTSMLLMPFAVMKSLLTGFVNAIEKRLRGRQQHVLLSVEFEDDNTGFDDFDAVNRPNLNSFR